MQGWKMRNWKMRQQNARVENAGKVGMESQLTLNGTYNNGI